MKGMLSPSMEGRPSTIPRVSILFAPSALRHDDPNDDDDVAVARGEACVQKTAAKSDGPALTLYSYTKNKHTLIPSSWPRKKLLQY